MSVLYALLLHGVIRYRFLVRTLSDAEFAAMVQGARTAATASAAAADAAAAPTSAAAATFDRGLPSAAGGLY